VPLTFKSLVEILKCGHSSKNVPIGAVYILFFKKKIKKSWLIKNFSGNLTVCAHQTFAQNILTIDLFRYDSRRSMLVRYLELHFLD